MKRRLLVLFSIIAITLFPLTAAWADSFKDTAGQWWEQPIAECSAADILGGRGAGLFAPKDSVTRLEAVVMLNRALGHRNEADTYAMSQGGYGFAADFPEWGKRNIAYAADKGYIAKAGIPSMQPKHPASRAEIAVLFANALKLSANGYELTFADKSSIPTNLQPFVAAAVKHGIMVGKAGNKFDPNANVTRGEMAVIIARLFENGKISPQPEKYLVVKISSIDVTNKKITVVQGGQTLTYSLATASIQYRSGAKSTLSSFKPGENVKIVLDTGNKVTFLAYTTANPSNSNISITTTYTGTIRGLVSGNPWTLSFQPDNDSLNSYPLLSSVKITRSGLTTDLTALTSGARAEIKVTGGNVSEINLLGSQTTGNEVKGYVVNVYLDYVTVRYDDGTSQEINKSTASSGFYQLVRGQRITLTKVGGIVTGITPVDEPRKVFGEVVNIGSSSITFEDGDGYERTLDFASGYKVKDKDGNSIDWDDVEKEDSVEIEINGQEKAVTIKLIDGSSSSDLEGEVIDLDTSGDYSIRIEKYNGSKKTYDVKASVDVYDQDGDDQDFDQIKEGDYVRLKLNSSDDVTRIDTLDVKLVEGEVTNVDNSGSWGISIKKSNGSEYDYSVNSKVKVWEDSLSRDFDDIDKGDNVRLLINSDDDVYIINILDGSAASDGTYDGVITSLDIDEDKLTIKKNSKSTTYTLSNDVEVDNGDKYLEDILIGCEVEIEVDNGKVDKIKITEDEDIQIEGELDDVRTDYVYLKQDNGTSSGVRHKLYFASNPSLKNKDGDSIDMKDLDDYEGKDVIIKLENGEIDSLEVK